MFKFSDKINLLAKAVKPDDLVESEILGVESTPLYLEKLSPELMDHCLGVESTVGRHPKNNTKKNIKTVWDVDIKHSGPGYFDDDGNFILDKPIKITNSWFVKEMDIVKGPLTDKELGVELKNVKEGALIKRDLDRGFVNLKDLLIAFPEFPVAGSSKDLNKYFTENQIIDNVESIKDEFFEESIVETNSRLGNFLNVYGISASVSYIVKTIKNKRKQHAINLVQRITGLDNNINSMLIDLIVESAGRQILLDVDKDGFMINNYEPKRK